MPMWCPKNVQNLYRSHVGQRRMDEAGLSTSNGYPTLSYLVLTCLTYTSPSLILPNPLAYLPPTPSTLPTLAYVTVLSVKEK